MQNELIGWFNDLDAMVMSTHDRLDKDIEYTDEQMSKISDYFAELESTLYDLREYARECQS